MKLKPVGLFAFGVPVLLLAIAPLRHLTVDATGPIHERLRNPTAGHGGGMGRKLPLQVAISVHGTPPNAPETTKVDFLLTNIGKNELTIPVSPNPGDFEPADPKVSYTVKLLNLFVTSGKRQESILPGRADLFGSPVFPQTLVTLAPGESIRVITRVALPTFSTEDRTSEIVLVAHAVLNDETIKTAEGQTILDTQDIGSATSPEYTIGSLFKSPD